MKEQLKEAKRELESYKMEINKLNSERDASVKQIDKYRHMYEKLDDELQSMKQVRSTLILFLHIYTCTVLCVVWYCTVAT